MSLEGVYKIFREIDWPTCGEIIGVVNNWNKENKEFRDLVVINKSYRMGQYFNEPQYEIKPLVKVSTYPDHWWLMVDSVKKLIEVGFLNKLENQSLFLLSEL